MSEVFPDQAIKDRLAGRLDQIERLWGRLVHVKWDRDTFARLAPLARDLVQAAKSHDYQGLAELAGRLEREISACMAAQHLPSGQEQLRINVLLERLHRSLVPEQPSQHLESSAPPEPEAVPPGAEILLAEPGEARQLVPRLGDAGYRVRHIGSLDAARDALIETPPKAAIVDVDFPEGPLSGIGMIAEVMAISEARFPVFFLAEHGDLNARLEAVRAGGAGYFTKPVDVTALVEKLNDQLFHQSARGYRVLIVDDTRDEADRIAAMLWDKGIVARVEHEPMQVIHALHRFHPDLLLLDLDLRSVSGMELAQVMRQHEACDGLPMVLLSAKGDLERHLAALGVGGDALISKPVNPDYLLSAVRNRLQRARAIQDKLSILSLKDPVSGLYNRQHFLAQLERATARLGITASSVSVMLVMLDNLRAVRDAGGVTVADEVVEQAARRMVSVLGGGYGAARFGDAIFVASVLDAGPEDLRGSAARLREALEGEVYDAGDQSALLRVSIGIGRAVAENADPVALIREADAACTMAREAGGDRIHLHETEEAAAEVVESHQERLLEEVRDAVQNERMGLVFQPVVSLRGDQVERYEVFLRMRDREGSELLPETVFGIAEKHRLGVALDRWVLAQSLRLLKDRQGRTRSTVLFVNVSLATLQDHSIAGWIQERLERTGVHPQSLIFEVAEATAEAHMGDLRRFLEGVLPLGCRLSLERFGARPDSMRHLKSARAAYVKLDPKFSDGLASNTGKQRELRNLVEALNAAGTITIVGGIEDLYNLPVLWSCGVSYVQGYFLQRPHKDMSYDFSGGVL